MTLQEANERLRSVRRQTKVIQILLPIMVCALIISYLATRGLSFTKYEAIEIDYKKCSAEIAVDEYCYADIIGALPLFEIEERIVDKNTGASVEYSYGSSKCYLAYDTDWNTVLIRVPIKAAEAFSQRLPEAGETERFYGKIVDPAEEVELVKKEILQDNLTDLHMLYGGAKEALEHVTADVEGFFEQYGMMEVDLEDSKEYLEPAGRGAGFYWFWIKVGMALFIFELIRTKRKNAVEEAELARFIFLNQPEQA